MKYIWLITGFDARRSGSTFQTICFNTEDEAIEYCKSSDLSRGVVYGYKKIEIGKMTVKKEKKVDSWFDLWERR